MKKVGPGVQGDLLNPALYTHQHQRSRTRWSSSNLIANGRSGAVSVTLKAALRVRGKALNEVESWALLCGAVQTLQDKILQAQGVFANLCNFDFLLVSADKLRLTFEGNIEIDSGGGQGYLHPEVGSVAAVRACQLEQLAIYSLGRTLEAASCGPRSLGWLLARMCGARLAAVPGLLAVMREVERYWREEVGATPASTLVSQLCQLSLGTQRPRPPRQLRTEFSCGLNTSSSSDSADDLRSSSSSLPKPPGLLPPHHPLHSPFGASMPVLLDQGDQAGLYIKQRPLASGQPRKYGRRLEFKPPMTQRLQRRQFPSAADGGLTNLDKSKSQSASELPGLRSRGRDRAAVTRSHTATSNARRLYRIVRPLARPRPSPAPATEDTERCIGPEFVVRSGQPVLQLDLAPGCSKSTTIMVVLLTGQRLELKVDPLINNLRQLLDIASDYIRLEPEDAARCGLMVCDQGEWLYLAPDLRLTKILPTTRTKEGVCSLTLYQRLVLLPASYPSLTSARARHLLYLQLRQDHIDGVYRADVSVQLAAAATAVHAEFGNHSGEVHGAGPYFLPQHFLPDNVRTLLGEKEAREMLQKLHKTKESEDLAEAEKSFCQQLMSLHDYGYFFYTGRQSKKQDSEPVLFAVHATGVYFFEISKNVFKPAKQVQFYAWKNIKEIQYNSNKMQLVMSENAAARVKIYLAENKAKHIFDLAEAHHAAHLARLQRGEEGSRGAAVTKQETFRDFCRKVKRYTMESAAGGKRVTKKRLSLPSAGRATSLKRSCSSAGRDQLEQLQLARGGDTAEPEAEPRYTVRRLTHYTSMAGSQTPATSSPAPMASTDKQYRYRVYLENEDDEELHSEMETDNVSCGEWLDTADLLDPEAEEKENLAPASRPPSAPSSDSVNRTDPQGSNPTKRRVSSVRMGTKVSAHALTRERLRSVTSKEQEEGLLCQGHPPVWTVPAPAPELQADTEDVDESLSMSLLERFDQMETEEGEPERRITQVTMEKDALGRLGIKISGTPSGIYIDCVDAGVARVVAGRVKRGDRIIAVNNRSLEHVSYCAALDIIRAAGARIEFLVSQLR